MRNAPLGRVQATIGNVLSPVGKALDKTLNVVAPLEFLHIACLRSVTGASW